jgi:hypothetical protein
MTRSTLTVATLGLVAGLATTGSAQNCGFPWMITVTPSGRQTVAVNICGTYAGCHPHNPQFTIAGSEIKVTLTGAELPDCICIAVQGTFSQTVLVHPVAPGDYTVTATLISCGQPIAAGATSFTFDAASAIPALDAQGIAAFVVLIAIAAMWRLRG